jgi:hypothetical protein
VLWFLAGRFFRCSILAYCHRLLLADLLQPTSHQVSFICRWPFAGAALWLGEQVCLVVIVANLIIQALASYEKRLPYYAEVHWRLSGTPPFQSPAMSSRCSVHLGLPFVLLRISKGSPALRFSHVNPLDHAPS